MMKEGKTRAEIIEERREGKRTKNRIENDKSQNVRK